MNTKDSKDSHQYYLDWHNLGYPEDYDPTLSSKH